MNEQSTLSAWLKLNQRSKDALGRLVGCSGEHIGRICKGDPRVSQVLALKIFDATGIKVGALNGMSDQDIAVVRRLNAPVAVSGAAA